MLKIPIRVLLFLSSYFPLYVIVMIREYKHVEIFYFFIPLMIVVSFGLWYTFSSLNRISGKYIEKGKVEDTGDVSLLYFFTYVIPFLTVDFFKWQELATYGIIFFIIGIIYVKSQLIHMNPTLFLLRYNIFKITRDGDSIIVITKNDNSHVLSNPVIEIGQGVYYERST